MLNSISRRKENQLALKVELKPNERIIIGTAVVRNGDQRTSLIIEGHAPILREKDILSPRTADTPAKLIYLTIQLMYIDGRVAENIGNYQKLMADFQQAVPSSTTILLEIHNHIINAEFYKALKEAKNLLAYERKLLDHAARNSGLREDPVTLAQSA
jgi:flagellar protein FlbT